MTKTGNSLKTTPYEGRIACFGEAMAELMLGSDASSSAALGFAGDTLNTAIYLRRLLGDTADVSFVTRLGRDSLSARTLQFIRSEKIKTDQISIHPERSIGLYAIETDKDGERSFSYWRAQSAARTLFEENGHADFSVLANYDVLCFSAITLAILPNDIRHALIAELQRLRTTSHVRVVFDSNYRPALWESTEVAQECVAAAWRITDIALPSIDDEQALFNDANEAAVLNRLHSYGIEKGALKRGALGPKALGVQNNTDGEAISFPEATHIVDTTAAGDSFNAGYLSALLSGSSDTDAMLAGHHCSLRVIANSGAIIPESQW
ncbi:MAG: sugar kinase [Granulosicoccus sp.]